ncbi:MAG: cyclopropane-fatty-acyl-phospholipid synthase [Paracoccaceae bacterium]|nr:cyclopropane-fatty-acyl-phospholipid synthase [Paracoccaceae bacterium]
MNLLWIDGILERLSRKGQERGKSLWKAVFTSLAQRVIQVGSLTMILPDGSSFAVGDGSGEPVTVRVHSTGFIRRCVLNAELAFGEGYMDESVTVDGDDIYGFLDIVTRNLDEGDDLLYRRLLYRWKVLTRFVSQFNPSSRARRNVAHHYDMSNDFYSLFLDSDLQYSCAYFPEPGMTLESAQAAKKRHIGAKLLLEPGMDVLDIGSGWGGMGITLAEDFGARVVGVTLSTEQQSLAMERVRDHQLDDRVEFRLSDYRAVPDTFDRIVSVGMFEHVGVPHYREFFRHMRRMLREGGVALLHTIGRLDKPGTTNDWIRKYVFPGGYVPALSEVMQAIEQERLAVTDVEIWQLHYAETLRCWRERFEANLDAVAEMFDARFCRMWRFYLIACEVTFRNRAQVVFQIQIARNKTSVPASRNYLYASTGQADEEDERTDPLFHRSAA